ncbi:MAG: DsbA family protein [Rhodospirillales bacterium]|nr:DsbA family protein [Rhodospirillales bacterium]MDE2199653.1 DsbA family protein [Rhodospirillales bacterium]
MKCRAAILLVALMLAIPRAAPLAQPAPGQSPAASSFSAAQRAEIVQILRDALKSDPSILRDAVTALQQDDGRQQAQATQARLQSFAPELTRTPGDPTAGNPRGDVTLVEFYDVRCPYCRSMRPVLARLLTQDRKIRVVYKDIPILGPGSVLAARAVLAAARQGAYQKLHDTLMDGTPNITEAVIQKAAEADGLNWKRLRADMDAPAIQARIDANLRLAAALHIEGTPAYVIGDTLLPGAVSLADLQHAVAVARAR